MGNVLKCWSRKRSARSATPEYHQRPGNLNDVAMARSVEAMNSDSMIGGASSAAVTTNSDLVIGIDFGTTFTGVAYAYAAGVASVISIAEMRSVAEKVRVIKTWPNRSNYYADKTPTVLAYNRRPPMWGGNVRPSDEPQVAYFKLGLHEDIITHYQQHSVQDAESILGGFLSDHDWRHPALPDMKAVDFAGDYLTRINQYVTQEVLPSHFGERFLQNQKVSYIVTVPAIWSDKAKQQTRQAAFAAGIEPEKLTLITEPEAAALYCATLCDEVDLEPGDRFMICDAGGGTVVCCLLDRKMLILRI